MPANRFKRKYYGHWDVFRKSYTREELESRRAQLAKVANSRILELERARSNMTNLPFYTGEQFDTVKDYLKTHTARGRRFSETRRYKSSDFNLKQEIYILEEFLDMQSSTVGGSRRREDRIYVKFEEKNVPRAVLDSPEFWRFLNSETFTNLVRETVDSEDILDIFDRASDAGQSVEDIVETFNKWKGRGTKSLFKSFGLSAV